MSYATKEEVLSALQAGKLDIAGATKMLDLLVQAEKQNAVPAGNVNVFVGPSGMVCFKVSSGTTITMREDMVRRLFSSGSGKLLDNGSLDYTPGKPLKDHSVLVWLNSNPITKHEAKKAGNFRGRMTPARPAFTAKLGVKTEFADDNE